MKKYLYCSGIIANLLFIFVLLLWARSIYWLGLPLPLYSQKVANDIRVKYPSAAFVTPVLDFFGSFEQKNFYFQQIDPLVWNGAGAKPDYQPSLTAGMLTVTDVSQLKQALKEAQPGTQIYLLPGRYEFERSFELRQAGQATAPIRLTGASVHQVQLVMHGEGFVLSQPYWQFENLSFIGECRTHDNCQHALHVVGKASDILIKNNVFRDFNSALKVNGSGGNYPDRGGFADNTVYNTSPRKTKGPGTPVDIVAADDWRVQHNFIFDIQKSAGDEVSYAGFIKGNASGGIFEQNLVMCEANIRGGGHTSIGLSFGGGGTGKQYSRDQLSRETTKGIMRHNIIMHCPNDVGIYLNEATDTLIEHNILYNTVGVDVRYKDSSAILSNNIISGRVNSREGGTFQLIGKNMIQRRSFLTGRDSLKDLFLSADLGDFSWHQLPEIDPLDMPFTPSENLDFCDRKPETKYLGAFSGKQFCKPQN